jgi:ABC-type Mn2+/Zn2+ transport system permease subunit
MEAFGEALLVPLTFPFMQRALLGCFLVGLLCSVVGVFVVLRNLSFIGQGLAQGALPGLAIGFVTGTSLYLSALWCAVLLALIIGFLRERGRVATDTAIAIAFSTATALGVALIAIVRFGPVDVNSYLFGNILAIGTVDLMVLLVAAIGLGALLVGLFNELVYLGFDPESAAAAGVAVRPLEYLFLAMVATVVVISLQTVGLLLVTAMLVIPAAAARQLAGRLSSMMLLSAGFGTGSSLVGLYASYHLRLPSGATIVLTLAIVFTLALAARSLREIRGRGTSVPVSHNPASP